MWRKNLTVTIDFVQRGGFSAIGTSLAHSAIVLHSTAYFA